MKNAKFRLFATIVTVLIVSSIIITGCDLIPTETAVPFETSLALYHAPIIYQDTDDTDPRSDYITRWDYDNNVYFTDNWENRDNYPLSAAVYYSVVESSTHWFILYVFFHPRHWNESSVFIPQEHENDMAGFLAVVKKSVIGGTPVNYGTGTLIGGLTVSLSSFYSYAVRDSGLTSGHEDIDLVLTFKDPDGFLPDMKTADTWRHQPKICIEPWYHSAHAAPWRYFNGGSEEDGIIYFPSIDNSEIPDSGNDRHVEYRLIPLWELWEWQLVEADLSRSDSTAFASWGVLKGDDSGSCGNGIFITCGEDKARTPWGWDDPDDGATYRGEWALDPIHLVDHYFDGLGTFSQTYINNRYLEDLRDEGYSSANLPRGWESKLDLDSMLAKLPEVSDPRLQMEVNPTIGLQP